MILHLSSIIKTFLERLSGLKFYSYLLKQLKSYIQVSVFTFVILKGVFLISKKKLEKKFVTRAPFSLNSLFFLLIYK